MVDKCMKVCSPRRVWSSSRGSVARQLGGGCYSRSMHACFVTWLREEKTKTGASITNTADSHRNHEARGGPCGGPGLPKEGQVLGALPAHQKHQGQTQ